MRENIIRQADERNVFSSCFIISLNICYISSETHNNARQVSLQCYRNRNISVDPLLEDGGKWRSQKGWSMSDILNIKHTGGQRTAWVNIKHRWEGFVNEITRALTTYPPNPPSARAQTHTYTKCQEAKNRNRSRLSHTHARTPLQSVTPPLLDLVCESSTDFLTGSPPSAPQRRHKQKIAPKMVKKHYMKV